MKCSLKETIFINILKSQKNSKTYWKWGFFWRQILEKEEVSVKRIFKKERWTLKGAFEML